VGEGGRVRYDGENMDFIDLIITKYDHASSYDDASSDRTSDRRGIALKNMSMMS
jgi:hypothetical protein